MEHAHYAFEELFVADEYLYFMEDTLREEGTTAQVDFIERALALESKMRVLDLGCGHGRHTNELARRGHDVCGVDLVEGFLDVARRDAAAIGVTPTFVRGDLRAFRAAEPFDRALLLFDVLGFFSDEENEQILRNVYEALSPGGKVLLDLRTREWIARAPAASVVAKENGDMMVDRLVFDVGTGRVVDHRTFIRNGAVRTVSFSVRLYSLTEIRLILRGVGFEVTSAFGGYGDAPPSLLKPRTLVVATRPG